MQKLIEWTEDMKICDLIDQQHKKIIELINMLYDAFVQARAKEVIQDIIKQLHDYTHFHFETEEKMFQQKGYKHAVEHIKEHNYLREQVKTFENRLLNGDEMLIYDVMLTLRDWLRNHILVTDKKYKDEIC